MKNKAKLKLAGVLLGAALSSTGAYAGNGSCGAGKCGGEAKKMEKKGACGAGKCGSNDEMSGNAGKKASGACGAGKCGANDKGQEMKQQNMMKKEAKQKVKGSCGAGKCGWNGEDK